MGLGHHERQPCTRQRLHAHPCAALPAQGIWRLPGGGIYATAVGYAAGSRPNPPYEEACSGQTGHTEAVQVSFEHAHFLVFGAASLLGRFGVKVNNGSSK